MFGRSQRWVKAYLSTNCSSLSLCTIQTWVTLKIDVKRVKLRKPAPKIRCVEMYYQTESYSVSFDARQTRGSWESTSSLWFNRNKYKEFTPMPYLNGLILKVCLSHLRSSRSTLTRFTWFSSFTLNHKNILYYFYVFFLCYCWLLLQCPWWWQYKMSAATVWLNVEIATELKLITLHIKANVL